jgi:hypothetical protein
MVFDDYSKYDGVLVGIGITIAISFISILVAPSVAVVLGVVGAVLMAIAMFAIPP